MSQYEQEAQLLKKLAKLVDEFSDYDPPRLRKDGDIVIPLTRF